MARGWSIIWAGGEGSVVVEVFWLRIADGWLVVGNEVVSGHFG